MFIAIDTLHVTGEAILNKNGSYAEQLATGRANAELAAHLIDRSGLWEHGGDLRKMYARCLVEATIPQVVDWYARRMQEVYEQRRAIWDAEKRLKDAWSQSKYVTG